MMVTLLVLLAISVALLQINIIGKQTLSMTTDIIGGLLLASTCCMLLLESGWFVLLAPPMSGLLVMALNRYVGIAARSDVLFKNEAQWLSVLLSGLLVFSWSLYAFDVSFSEFIAVASVIVLITSVFLHLLLLIHINRYRLNPHKQLALDQLDALPTVSMLIPARNESHALNSSIIKVLQSTYPKLEVLILDDCSHDKTPEIIRSFAHDGARFIEGTPPPDNWLGRNWAQHQLADAANGELLIFADVDVKFSKNTIADIVGVMQRDNLDMVSFVPQNSPSGLLGWLLPSLTNFWLSLIPFRLLHGRASIGRCFAITSESIKQQPLSNFKHSIYPVYSLTKSLLKHDVRYKFFYGKNIGMSIQHHYHSTTKSLLRTLSPAISNRFDLGVLIEWFAVIILGVVSGAFFSGDGLLAVVTFTSVSLLFVTVAYASSGPKSALLALLWPLHVIHESIHLVISLIRYRFTDLTWKERRVCMPVLQTHEKLPEV
jgi:hypothetical protein